MSSGETRPGELVLVRHGETLAIAARSGALVPHEVQAEGRRALPWPDYLRGARLGAGAVFGPP